MPGITAVTFVPSTGFIAWILTLPWLKPRDSCELGLLALGR